MSSCLVPVEGQPMGRDSGSPPAPPHSHIDSEPVSTSWNLRKIHRASRCTHSDSSTCSSHECSYSDAHMDGVSNHTHLGLDCTSFQCIQGNTCICLDLHTLHACNHAHTGLHIVLYCFFSSHSNTPVSCRSDTHLVGCQ